MHLLQAAKVSRMDRAIEILDALFVGRRDTYVTFDPGPDGRGVKYSGRAIHQPLTEDVWREHVRGNAPVGIYPLHVVDGVHVCRWASIDIDQDKKPGFAIEIAQSCVRAADEKLAEPVPIHLEITKSGQVHLWLFFEEPTEAWKARAVARTIVEVAGHRPYTKGQGEEIVIFPTSDRIPAKTPDGKGGVGKCMYVPWFGRNAAEGRQVFADPSTGSPYQDQIGAMESARRISPSCVEHLIDAHGLKPENVKAIARRPETDRFVPKADAGTVPALTDQEFANLCGKLKCLRAMRETPGACSYQDWFAGLMHLVPFADGRDRAHELSRLDSVRYDGGVVERQWQHCVALYSQEGSQPEARVSQRIVEFWRGGGRPDITPIAPDWAIFNGCFAKRKFSESGQEKDPLPITNFTASVICEEYMDDGSGERSRCVRVRGQLMTGQLLPEITVRTSQWPSAKEWIHTGWGFRPVIYGTESQVIQCISLSGQEAPERIRYLHTGWTKDADGKPMFLTPYGPRGCDVKHAEFEDTASVKAPGALRGYQIPETVTESQVREAYHWIERFLDCGDLQATAPVMAAMFLAPLASFLNLDFALFLTGYTGSHKSSLIAAAMAVWGAKWSKDTLPASFNDTANALEALGFYAKDLPLPIDNYVPSIKGDAQATLKRISHSFADHAGRGRLNRQAEMVAGKPFRGLCIITGEDVPFGAGAGATNRYYIVPMARETLRLMDLEAVQEAGWAGKMAPAMTHYLRWLTERMTENPEWPAKVAAFQYQAEKEARRAAAGKEHDRLTSQTAWMRTAMKLILQSHPGKAWADQSLAKRIDSAFGAAIEARRTMSREASLSHRFLSSIEYLVQSGKVHGVEVATKVVERKNVTYTRAPINPMAAQVCGWRSMDAAPYVELVERNSRVAMWVTGCVEDPNEPGKWDIGNAFLCIKGNEIVTEIKQTLRAECPIVEGGRGITQALISDGILQRGVAEDRVNSRICTKTGQPDISVWKLRLVKVLQMLDYDITGASDSATPGSMKL